MKISGIYAVINKINKKMYIGQSENCYNRWLQHKTKYKTNFSLLYNDMRELGLENFYFKILEKTPPYLLNTREKYYIEKYNSIAPNGYNINKGTNYNGADDYLK